MKEQVECLAEQLLNGAVLIEGEQLELLRDAGVEITDECLFTPAAGCLRLQARATFKSGIGNFCGRVLGAIECLEGSS